MLPKKSIPRKMLEQESTISRVTQRTDSQPPDKASTVQHVAVGTAQRKVQGNPAVLLVMAQNSPADIQAQIMDMARSEQTYRHELTTLKEQHAFALNQERIRRDSDLQERQLRNIFRTDIVGKVVGSIFFLALAAVAFRLIWDNRIREVLMLLGCTAVLGIFIKCFSWLMSLNHSAKENGKE